MFIGPLPKSTSEHKKNSSTVHYVEIMQYTLKAFFTALTNAVQHQGVIDVTPKNGLTHPLQLE